MRAYRTRYTLRNGTQGVLTVLARSSCEAILAAIETFGEQLRSCAARPAALP